MPSDPGLPMAVDELFELRRSLEVGLARIDGQLTLLTHRDDQSERELAELGTRLSSLEHTRWPLPALTAVTALGALAVAVWQALGR
ncbi:MULTISPECIES: hypothetical protein [unclassified Streptomyces]|uniref:hypothetical protein n=1 Tax=unclassified Streptomyces TaxID=2593676 RepID=UPI00340FA903